MSAQTPPDDGFGLYFATIAGGEDDDDFAERYRPRCEDCGFPQDHCLCDTSGDADELVMYLDDAEEVPW